MPLREDILNPIPGPNPSGQTLRFAPLYDKIKEARREDDSLDQGDWKHERKVADHAQVIKLAQEAIATQSKDLQLAAWLCESLLKKEGIRGLRDGVSLCADLLDRFWDTLYPEIQDDELDDRVAPLEWMSSKLLIPIKNVPLCLGAYDFFQYKASRTVEYEELAKSKDQKTAREKALKEGKLAPELFDKSFAETPKAFYLDLEKQFDGTLEGVRALDATCGPRFGREVAPSFSKLQETLQEVRHVVHQFLQKKREIDPDPVEPPPPPIAAETPLEPGPGGMAVAVAASAGDWGLQSITGRATTEPADHHEAIATVVAAASVLRKRDAFSPAPYLMLRGLRWGELRGSSDPDVLEAPPGDLRLKVKRLALERKWRDLLELGENIMALPCSRAWLDLQRLVVEACAALGDDYRAIAIAIRSEMRALLRDLPHLMDITLNDDTPAANPETQAWLRELLAEPTDAPLPPKLPRVPSLGNSHASGWQKKYVDAHVLALEAMRAGQAQKAIEILQHEVEKQLCGRGRFQRKLQLAQICLAAGKDTIAQPLLDDIAAEIETHKLDDWEDREMVAGALAFLLQTSKKVQADAKMKQAFFERICRLDPVQALSV